jgi:hypothetical protein
MPDLARIAETSGLTTRKLRYVLDQGLLPGGKVVSRGRGAPRSFTPGEAFALVIAAMMLDAGLKRALVRDCMAQLCRPVGRDPVTVPLFRAMSARGPSRLEVGDWRYVRLLAQAIPQRRLTSEDTNTGWLPLGDQTPPASGYTPLVSIGLDLGQLRAKVER